MQVLPQLFTCFLQTAGLTRWTDHRLEQTPWPRGGTERGREPIIINLLPSRGSTAENLKKVEGVEI